jgi:hypothetical protein
MNPLYRQAIIQGVFGLIFFIALIFGTAGTWEYWQGWVFLAVFAASTTAFTLYLALYDTPLLERRLKAGPWHEEEQSQKIIVSLIFLAFFAFIILPILRLPIWPLAGPGVGLHCWECDYRLLVPRDLLGYQGQQLGGIQYPCGGRSESHRYWPVCVCAAPHVCRSPLAVCRDSARARLVVVGRARDPILASIVVASPR